ncbi:MAG: hypothetical protein ACRDRJ_01665 [Streptosporangiaceae bacterium]
MPEDPFPIFDVSEWEVVDIETSGAEEKYWLAKPGTTERWLFKSVTIKEGIRHGEDWAEKSVAHLGAMLGVPCAVIEMAVRNEGAGCIGADLRPESYQLQPGRVLLEERQVPGYIHQLGKSHPGHSAENIRTALAGALPPPGCDLPFDATAFDVFAGFLVLDAWVANMDRHDHNWAVLSPATASGGPMRLCSSYDHGNSLGFNVTDEKRRGRLASPASMGRWCRKGIAQRFACRPDGSRLSLVELAVEGLSLASPPARAHWPQQLNRIDDAQVLEILARAPRMSDAARSFAVCVLDINRRRILDACG